MVALAFSGIHVISPRFLQLLCEEGVFSIINSYLRLAEQGERILAFRADDITGGTWERQRMLSRLRGTRRAE